MKSTEHIMNNVDGEELLKQVGLVDLLGDWKDGILTIGTLGYEHMKTFNQNKEYFALENENELDNEDYYGEHILVEGNDDYNNYNNGELEELKPLIHTIFENNFEDVISANSSNNDANNSSKEKMVDYHGTMESKNVESDPKKKGERTTLAELFLADSNAHKKVGTIKTLLQSSEKPSLNAKCGMLFPKKFIPHVKDNPHPIKHIKKLMKKMMKNKIHPYHDVKNHKLEGQKANDEEIIDNDHKHGASDTTSLLPI
ncbi:hypothetical protein TanjilG_29240 [Lupinus angustifolius]|uniref:Protein TILLER ANGLE CONTROL 1 n=2 Tax=Lupinus angustifolius TaxID=3871 RepID=A0A1J7IL62_LUPAN|nr:hypothetical protein TanjilG_29240 [Lupinus angustifolius]